MSPSACTLRSMAPASLASPIFSSAVMRALAKSVSLTPFGAGATVSRARRNSSWVEGDSTVSGNSDRNLTTCLPSDPAHRSAGKPPEAGFSEP